MKLWKITILTFALTLTAELGMAQTAGIITPGMSIIPSNGQTTTTSIPSSSTTTTTTTTPDSSTSSPLNSSSLPPNVQKYAGMVNGQGPNGQQPPGTASTQPPVKYYYRGGDPNDPYASIAPPARLYNNIPLHVY